MKRTILSAIYLCLAIILEAQETPLQVQGSLLFRDITEETIGYVLVSDANMRDKPSTKGTIVAQLAIATKVAILEQSKDSLTLNGVAAPWFKIKVNGKTGYLWSGFLTSVALTTESEDPKDFDKTYLAGISSYKDGQVTLQVRLVKNGKEVSKLEFPSVGDLYYDLSLTLRGGYLDKVTEVLSVGCTFGACAYGQAEHLVFHTEGGKLQHIMQMVSSADAGAVYASENAILPNEKGGIADHVLVISDEAETEELNQNGKTRFKTVNQKYGVKLYKWTGAKLQLVKEIK